jgi:hypothetical protein
LATGRHKVRIRAEMVDGKIVVTKLEPVQ